MDNESAKERLSAYRKNAKARDQPPIADALRLVAQSSALQTSLESEIEQDTRMKAAMASITAPPNGKEAIAKAATPLLAKTQPNNPARWRYIIPGLAASVAIAAAAWLARESNNISHPTQSIAIYASKIDSLQYKANDLSHIKSWLQKQNFPTDGLPAAASLGQPLLGCSTLHDKAGHPISIVCIEVGKGVAHLFIIGNDSHLAAEMEKGLWLASNEINIYAWSDAKHTYAIATTLAPQNIEQTLGAAFPHPSNETPSQSPAAT